MSPRVVYEEGLGEKASGKAKQNKSVVPFTLGSTCESLHISYYLLCLAKPREASQLF